MRAVTERSLRAGDVSSQQVEGGEPAGEAVAEPGHHVGSRRGADAEVVDALVGLQLDRGTGVAEGLDVAGRHLGPHDRVGGALGDQHRRGQPAGAWGVLREEVLPGRDLGRVAAGEAQVESQDGGSLGELLVVGEDAALGDLLDQRDGDGLEHLIELGPRVDVAPRDHGIGGQQLARGGVEVALEQLGELGRRRRRGDPDEVELGRVVRCHLAREQRRVTALGVAPHRHLLAGAGLLQPLRGAHAVEDSLPLAGADQIRMDPRRAEAGVVGGRHHVAGSHQVGRRRDAGEEAPVGVAARRRAGGDDPARAVGPCHDRSTARGGIAGGGEDPPAHGDGLAVHAGRVVEHSPPLHTLGQVVEGLGADDVAGRALGERIGWRVEGRGRLGLGRPHEDGPGGDRHGHHAEHHDEGDPAPAVRRSGRLGEQLLGRHLGCPRRGVAWLICGPWLPPAGLSAPL